MKALCKTLFYLLVLAGLCGCSLSRQAIASLQSTSHFLALDPDKRILYEPGAEEIGGEIAEYLPGSIVKVEKKHYRPFKKPVEVYICASKESFSRATGLSGEVKGVTTTKHIFLSAERLGEMPRNIREAVLTHELSHLHLQQYLGAYRYGSHLPAWFQEGLAEFVSGSTIKEKISLAETEKAILSGNHIVPGTTGSFFFPQRWNAYGLEPHMFYGQCFMFVSYLKNFDPTKFRAFLLVLEDGKNFKESFSSIFSITMEQAWDRFVSEIRGHYTVNKHA